MAEAMSDEQESEPCDVHGWRDCKRCRNRNPVSDWASAQREIARLNDELRTVQVELKQARAQLAESGETKAEWAADGPAGWFQSPAGARSEWSERFARGVVEGAATKGVEVKLKRRFVGGWQDAE